MGAVLEGLSDTGRIVVDHPVVLVAAVLTGVLAPVVSFVLGLIPLLGGLAYFVFVQPVFVGGLLNMAVDAAEGDVSADSYVEGVTGNYGSLAGVYAILVGITLALTVVAGVLAVVFGLAGAIGGSGTAGPAADPGVAALGGAIGGVGVVVLVSLVVALAVAVVVQFVEAAVVVGDAGAGGAYSDSLAVLRDNPLSVMGYTLVRLVLYALAQAVPLFLLFGAVGLLGADSGADAVLGTATLVALALLGVLGYVGLTVYHALYYRRVTGRDGGDGSGRAAGGTAAQDPMGP